MSAVDDKVYAMTQRDGIFSFAYLPRDYVEG